MEEVAAHASGDDQTSLGVVALGKGAWDCDKNCEIPPELEAEVFEEIPTMEFPFHGIPTIPLRKDMDHMSFFCNGCRYRVTAYPSWTASKVKQALFAGGIARSNIKLEPPHAPGIRAWNDLTLIYAGQMLEDDKPLVAYGVPPGCQCLIAIETARLMAGPEPGSVYWA